MTKGSKRKHQQGTRVHVNKYAKFSKADQVAAQLDSVLARQKKQAEEDRQRAIRMESIYGLGTTSSYGFRPFSPFYHHTPSELDSVANDRPSFSLDYQFI